MLTPKPKLQVKLPLCSLTCLAEGGDQVSLRLEVKGTLKVKINDFVEGVMLSVTFLTQASPDSMIFIAT